MHQHQMKHHPNPHLNRSTLMNLMHEDLARAHSAYRLAEAHSQRRGHHVVAVRRLSRRAERAAQAARLAAARV